MDFLSEFYPTDVQGKPLMNLVVVDVDENIINVTLLVLQDGKSAMGPVADFRRLRR